jgi:hypothetical protein
MSNYFFGIYEHFKSQKKIKNIILKIALSETSKKCDS